MCNFRSILVCFILTIVSFSVTAQRVVPPRNEASKDPSLTTFVKELVNAIETRDAEWIYSKLDQDVISTYGDEQTIDVFKSYWDLKNDSTNFWPYLRRVVNMGGVFLHDTADHSGKFEFVFPYVYDIDMELDDDYYLLGAITGKNVNLRTAPDTKSKVVTQLSDHVIYYIYDEEDVSINVPLNIHGEPTWYHITTYDKKYTGWVNWQYVYSPMGPRLFLYNNDKGIWKISAFVAGD